jgi:DNA-binding CsgD family transcriptional regulator
MVTRTYGNAEVLPGVFLTPKQRVYAAHVRAGTDDRTIAAEMGIALPTARQHRKNLYRRLSVKTKEAAHAALQKANLNGEHHV